MCVCVRVGMCMHLGMCAFVCVCVENSTFFFARPTYAKLLLLSDEKKKKKKSFLSNLNKVWGGSNSHFNIQQPSNQDQFSISSMWNYA